MNPTEIIMTGEKVSYPNLAGLSNKIVVVSNSLVKEKSIVASHPRGSKNLTSKSVDIFPPSFVVELMLWIHIFMDFFHPVTHLNHRCLRGYDA